MNTEKTNNFIEIVSKGRFGRYLALAKENQELAIKLYTINAQISQSLYIPIQGLEIALRNRIDNCLKDKYGEFWFDKSGLLKTTHQLEDVGLVKARIFDKKKNEKFPLIHDRIIAGFSFGFWTSLFGDVYEDLWRRDLYKISSDDAKSITRKTFSGPLKNIREIRNRVAHHECILNYDLNDQYFKMVYLALLLSKESEFWIKENSDFETRYKEHKETLLSLKEGRS